MLIEADVVRGRKLTSFCHVFKTDLKNAGAQWVDEEVVVDNGLVTSRSPDDLPAFNAKMIEEIAEGHSSTQRTCRIKFLNETIEQSGSQRVQSADRFSRI